MDGITKLKTGQMLGLRKKQLLVNVLNYNLNNRVEDESVNYITKKVSVSQRTLFRVRKASTSATGIEPPKKRAKGESISSSRSNKYDEVTEGIIRTKLLNMEVLLLLLFCIFIIVAILIILCQCDRRSSEYRYSNTNNLPRSATSVTIEEVVLCPTDSSLSSQYVALKPPPTDVGGTLDAQLKNEPSHVAPYSKNAKTTRQYPSHRRIPYPTDPEMTEASYANNYRPDVVQSADDVPPPYAEAVKEQSSTLPDYFWK